MQNRGEEVAEAGHCQTVAWVEEEVVMGHQRLQTSVA